MFLLLLTATKALEDGSATFYRSSIAQSTGDNSTAIRVLLKDAVANKGARCLDGSPAAFYFRKGVGSGANKWYIHHQGGGWCETWDDCLGRSATDLGSSANYPANVSQKGGYFDPSPVVNPMMYNWNMVYMRYCDGGSFSGNNESVTTYKGKPLYYRGKRNREAMYDALVESYNLGGATDAVISGCSAGGLATFIHTDQWCDALAVDAPGIKCVGMPDSGFFLDYQDPRRNGTTGTSAGLGTTVSGNYHVSEPGLPLSKSPTHHLRLRLRPSLPSCRAPSPACSLTLRSPSIETLSPPQAGLKWVFETMNTTAGVNQDCINAKETGGSKTDSPAYLCQFAEHTAVYTHTPMFPLQSEYDSWQTGHVLYYPNSGADVQAMGDNITKRIGANLFGPHPRSGAFLDSCWHHCGMWNQIRIDGDLVSVAFQKWYDGLENPKAKRVWAQDKPYKCDACCQP
jgi:hypothetical protein